VASADSASELAVFSGRRRLLLAGLGMICLLVVGGSYLIGRATTRELAVARLQTEFVSAVSHEFRTPLAAMRHLTELLEGGIVTAEERRRRYYSLLSRETRRLHRLVEGLLNFGRMEAGRQQYRLEGLDITEFVEEVVEEFQRESATEGYSVELSGKANLRAKADPEGLSLALWNLLDNAMKYSPECRTIWVQVREQGRQAAIQVRDKGLGIAPEERAAVFEKFVRGASSRATGGKGTGIGLALVRHIVQAHGGEIRLESEPGHGTTFSILLEMETGTA
jgi:signal transduction histidine kinase